MAQPFAFHVEQSDGTDWPLGQVTIMDESFISRAEFLTVVKSLERGQDQLSKQMTEGFSGVNTRLDHLSDRVAVSEREAAMANTTIAVLQERTKALDDLPKLRERVSRSEWRIGLIIGGVTALAQFLMWWWK